MNTDDEERTRVRPPTTCKDTKRYDREDTQIVQGCSLKIAGAERKRESERARPHLRDLRNVQMQPHEVQTSLRVQLCCPLDGRALSLRDRRPLSETSVKEGQSPIQHSIYHHHLITGFLPECTPVNDVVVGILVGWLRRFRSRRRRWPIPWWLVVLPTLGSGVLRLARWQRRNLHVIIAALSYEPEIV